MSPKYNTDNRDGMRSDPSPWDAPYRDEGGYRIEPDYEQPHTRGHHHNRAARGLMQMFAIHPAPASFVIVVDSMVSAVDFATLGISAPVLWLIASIVTFVVVFKAQTNWAGDDRDSALTKAAMVSFLVALPTPFPAFLTVPSAIAGTVQMIRRRR